MNVSCDVLFLKAAMIALSLPLSKKPLANFPLLPGENQSLYCKVMK